MSFTSLQFLLFLPLVFVLYWTLRRSVRWQNLLLICASYVFYGWWDWRFLGLIALTTAASFASGLLLERYDGHERRRRWITAANIVLNLGILALFKYYDFFADNLSAVLRALGLHADLPTLRLILPVGISFYTFQALSYTIDVHRRQLRATRDVLAFFAYIAFFPQLVAGPIERATHLLPQMLRARTFNYTAAADGLRQMLWGFAKKMLVADTCALAVDIIWQSPGEQSALVLAVGAVLFSVQIYGDFSGYSDIAVGCARLFGIQLMQNFRTPYFAASITDFWRRWHISLMTWLRDYVDIPLGGNRCSRLRQYANTLTTFLLSGLWHGAAWTYVLWGLYHGLLVCIEKALKTLNSPKLSTTLNSKLSTLTSSKLYTPHLPPRQLRLDSLPRSGSLCLRRLLPRSLPPVLPLCLLHADHGQERSALECSPPGCGVAAARARPCSRPPHLRHPAPSRCPLGCLLRTYPPHPLLPCRRTGVHLFPVLI